MEKLQRALELARSSAHSDRDGPELARAVRLEAPTPVRHPSWRRDRRPVLLDRSTLARLRLRAGAGGDSVSEAYRVLRTHVLQRLARHAYQTLAIVSATADEGKTLTAINLAFAVAQDHRHTALLVDFDLRAPGVHRALGLSPESGIEAYFDGSASIDELIVGVMNERMAILPCTRPIESPAERLASSETHALVKELATRYADRVVLFDLSPMLVGDDVIAFLPSVDAVLVVIEEGRTRKDDLGRVFELLGDTPVVGTVLNRARTTALEVYR